MLYSYIQRALFHTDLKFNSKHWAFTLSQTMFEVVQNPALPHAFCNSISCNFNIFLTNCFTPSQPHRVVIFSQIVWAPCFVCKYYHYYLVGFVYPHRKCYIGTPSHKPHIIKFSFVVVCLRSLVRQLPIRPLSVRQIFRDLYIYTSNYLSKWWFFCQRSSTDDLRLV